MNMTKEDILCYTLIIATIILLLKPSNLKHRHVHLTTALTLSYLILLPSNHMEIRRKLYNVRILLLLYFVIDFEIDPMISLFLMILYLMLVYQVKYENVTYGVPEGFTNMNTEVKKELGQKDNYNHDNKQYQFESEYKHDNDEDVCNGRKHITEEQLEKVSRNGIVTDIKEIATFKDGYSAQGTSFVMGSNFEEYGDLNTESNML